MPPVANPPANNPPFRRARKPKPTGLRLLPLVAAIYFMVSGGPYGLEDIIGMAGFGRALLLLAIVPILWSLPTALMVGELASAIPDEGGFYVWAHRALGRFWGFQVAWLSLASSVFDMAIYPTTVSLYLMTVFPELRHGHYALMFKLSIVIIATLWNLRGAVSVGHGSVRMMAISLAPFAVMLVIALWRIAHGGLHLAAGGQTLTYDLGGALSVTMWNYMGWDNASTIAQEVENPQRDYPRAMFVSALTVMCVYTLPLLAVWAVGIPAARFSTGAWADAAGLLGGSVLAMAVVFAGSLDGLGTFNALTLTLTRLPYAMAEDRLLPRILTLRTRKGVPWVSVLLCGLTWALALGLTFERLISIDLVLWGASLVLEFLSLIVLRRTEPGLKRPFRIPGNQLALILIGCGPMLLLAFALFNARTERMAGMNALLFATIIGLAGPLIYALMAATRRRET
ncbi:MAG TPA: APC family permease [Candidatus Aquilonibacter sp.]|nr:APC family permease [Candidatus Aquilonibacter sp.]